MKYWLTILALVFSMSINASDKNLDGVWVSDSGKVEMTFSDDSLFIDEVGVEGDCYVYHLENDIITVTDCLGEQFTIKIVEFINGEMYITYLDFEQREVYCFKKKA